MVPPALDSAYPDGAVSPSISASAASWPAIIAGAFVATAVSLILLALGSGLSFSSMPPWPNKAESAIWLILTQWISAGISDHIALADCEPGGLEHTPTRYSSGTLRTV